MKIISAFLIFCLNLCSLACADDDNIVQYLGPKIGVENFYSGSDGSKMIIVGKSSSNESSLLIEETFFYPAEALTPNTKSQQKLVYELYIADGKLIKKYKGKQEVLLSNFKNESNWFIKGSQLNNNSKGNKGEWKQVDIKCWVSDIRKENVLGKNISVITKKCEYRNMHNVFIKIERYGQKIGLIERSQNILDTKGKLKEVFKLKLDRISKRPQM